MKMYQDSRYAQNRLLGTIILIKGKAEKVADFSQDERGRDIIITSNLLTGRSTRTIFKDVDLTPVPLGYVNYNDMDAWYLSRMPKRQDWKQGLRAANSIQMTVGNSPQRLRQNISPKAVGKTIENIFPNMRACYEMSSNSGLLKAFSRNFGIKQNRLHYKGLMVIGDVGKGINNGIDLKLHKEFKWLEESLDEELNYAA